MHALFADSRSVRRRIGGFLCFACFLCLFFVSALSAQQPAPIRFAVIGDSGTGGQHQYRIADQMAAWHERLPYDLVLMLGDNIYGGLFGIGGGNQDDFAKKFDRPYAELLARGVIFRAALGNHDAREAGGRDLIAAYDRFHIEGPQGYYSFTAGEWVPAVEAAGLNAKKQGAAPLVEFFVLNTTRLEKDKQDPEQLAWLEQALSRSRARWRIVYGHHPLYSTGKRHGGDARLRKKLESLLTGEGVQVVLAGHDHIYQRFHPQGGVVYFVCGSSGKLRRGNARPDSRVAAVEDQQRVFMLWDATAEELRFRAINEQGQAFDCGAVGSSLRVEQIPCAELAGAR
jgi:3',5'-cyclic AMP phosphodiesterase CpdA